MARYLPHMGATSKGTGHSESLRLILKEARNSRKWSAKYVGERISRRLQDLGDVSAKPVSPSAIYAWEDFHRHPSVDNFAAWAFVLGYRLIVTLDAAASKREPVLVRTDEAAEAARRIDLLPPDKRTSILEVVRAMTPSHPD